MNNTIRVKRRVSKLDNYIVYGGDMNSSINPVGSFVGGGMNTGSELAMETFDKYIKEIKHLKSEILMYKTYIGTINDKLEIEVKQKNSYIENLK